MSAFDRLFDKTSVQENGCWNFTGRLNHKGYGEIWDGKKRALAHRLAYLLCVDDIPTGMLVLHNCDNPSCVNPKHLFLGTNQDNMNDMVRKGRSVSRTGLDNPRAILIEREIAEVRQMLSNGFRQKEIADKFGVSVQTISRINVLTDWSRH
jgi:hypothetical protein